MNNKADPMGLIDRYIELIKTVDPDNNSVGEFWYYIELASAYRMVIEDCELVDLLEAQISLRKDRK